MKIFVARSTFLKVVDNDCVGGLEFNRHSQGVIFVKAKNKASALEKLSSFGYTLAPPALRVSRGTDTEALVAADVITEDSVTLTSSNHPLFVAKAVINENGERTVSNVGVLQPLPETYKYEFVPVAKS